jgi:ferric-dicitrate binding protein FerR (iron transport regulator)
VTQQEKAVSEQSEEEALTWYLENQRGEDIDEATVHRWGEWWDKPENRAAYAEIVEIGEQLQLLSRPRRVSDEELRTELQKRAVSVNRSSSENFARFPLVRRPFFRGNRTTLYASSVGLLLGVIGLSVAFRFWAMDPGQKYVTVPGEQRVFTLKDGSSMTLGGDSSVNVRFTSSGRRVDLGHGEGMFYVHHDTSRPFTVCAANGCTTAVGTVFDVRLYSNHVRIWVQQGAVEVKPQEWQAAHKSLASGFVVWPAVRVVRGQEVDYDPERGAGSTQAADTLNASAWTQGSLVYFGRPLGEVIEDVQRYSARHIDIDPGAAAAVYSGSVVQQHVDQWIRGLSEVFSVDVIDCRRSQESVSNRAEVRSWCTADPDRILIRSR